MKFMDCFVCPTCNDERVYWDDARGHYRCNNCGAIYDEVTGDDEGET